MPSGTQVHASSFPSNLADIVGRTPMVRLTRVAPECGAELCGKLEAYNPAGSVKDRIGVAMIDAAERDGRIEPGRTTIVEPTSGNTGIALAFVCAARGYDLVLTMPQGMSRERETLLKMYGAQVEITESMGGMNEAVEAAERIAGTRDDAYIPNQFANPANPEIHRRTTAEEIWEQTGGEVDVLVAGVGTGGTITGCGERLKERNPDLHVVAVEPKSSPVISGGRPGPHRIQGIGAGFVPSIFNREIVDEIAPVPGRGRDRDLAQRLARAEGVLAGMSCGAALWASIEVGSRPEWDGKRIVDGAARLGRALRDRALLPAVTGPVKTSIDLTGVACPMNWVQDEAGARAPRARRRAGRAARPGRAARVRAAVGARGRARRSPSRATSSRSSGR